MKIYLFPIVIGGFVITIILQGVLFTSTSLQSQGLQKQLTELSEKLDQIKLSGAVNSPEATKLKETLTKTKPAETDPDNLLSPEKLSQTLGTTTTSNVRLKSGLTTAKAYENTETSSPVIGTIQANRDYPLVSYQGDWYLIKLDLGKNAWVQSSEVYETL